MSNIASAFANGKAFIGFVTGGDPTMAKTEEYILALADAGADLIEIGIPFSDPIAEGPVIQRANIRALSAGATVDKLFDLVVSIREKIHTPIVFLTYLNPVFHYGYDAFFAKCRVTGVDGIIIPDLPFEEQAEAKTVASNYDIDIITLIAPTSEDRIRKIAEHAAGFIYVVSSMGVTGVRSEIRTDLPSIIASIRTYTDVPVAVGFGIHTPEQATEISKIADGVIVGSKIVTIIEEHPQDAAGYLREYAKSMKAAVGNRDAAGT
ncbi:MAG: tryptophan synthase subunit alpha [Clostridiales Family XIII bacterium]|nr:tryptophan synthase subunit alpha [Clostridiales Family XIII bacterium]